MSGCLMRKRKG